MKSYLVHCPKCSNILQVDDIDYQFKGCQDEVSYCSVCDLWYFVKVRYNKIVKVVRQKD